MRQSMRCQPSSSDPAHNGRQPDRGSDQVGDGRVDLYAGSCSRGALRRCPDRRPSISACRCRQALAIYPQARAGSPQTPAQTPPRGGILLTLLRVGFTKPSRSPGTLVVSYTTVSPLPGAPKRPGGLFSVALSRGSPRVAVNNHPALWSPDVPRRRVSPPTRPPSRLVRRARQSTDTRGANAHVTRSAGQTFPSPPLGHDRGAGTAQGGRLPRVEFGTVR